MKKTMTVKEAGRKGGIQCKKNHSKEYFQELGRKGGVAASKRREVKTQ